MSVSDLRYDEDNGEETTRTILVETARGWVERQESRCRRRGFANVWLTGVRRREKRRGRDERREARRPDVVSAGRRVERRKGDTKRGTMTRT